MPSSACQRCLPPVFDGDLGRRYRSFRRLAPQRCDNGPARLAKGWLLWLAHACCRCSSSASSRSLALAGAVVASGHTRDLRRAVEHRAKVAHPQLAVRGAERPALAAGAAHGGRVIVLLKKKNADISLARGLGQRRAVDSAQQAPIVANIKRFGGSRVRKLTLVNGGRGDGLGEGGPAAVEAVERRPGDPGRDADRDRAGAQDDVQRRGAAAAGLPERPRPAAGRARGAAVDERRGPRSRRGRHDRRRVRRDGRDRRHERARRQPQLHPAQRPARGRGRAGLQPRRHPQRPSPGRVVRGRVVGRRAGDRDLRLLLRAAVLGAAQGLHVRAQGRRHGCDARRPVGGRSGGVDHRPGRDQDRDRQPVGVVDDRRHGERDHDPRTPT